MNIDISKILDSELLQVLGNDNVNTINKAVNKEFDSRVTRLESDTSNRFETLVENLTEKFDTQVNQVIVEDFRENVGKSVDAKLYDVIKSMANVLESAGIPVTEKTKELQASVKDLEKRINDMVDEHDVMTKQLKDSNKENWIHKRLEGMRPEVISHALEYFQNKDILDVQDEIETILNNDFSNLVLDVDDGLSSDIDLDRVKDALQGLDEKSTDMNELSSKSKFESLGKGLKNQRVMVGRTPDVDKGTLIESHDAEVVDAESDTQEALDKIDDFNNLGYRFK